MPPNGNEFEYACFISYKHPPKTARDGHFYLEFAEEFRKRLEYYLSTSIRTYIDIDADPGSSYPEDLPAKLCKSVCMIAVLVNEYPDSSWCRAEWDAMERLEKLRLNGKRGLIIPIALRREPRDWENLFKRKPVDFSKISVPSQLLTAKQSEKIQKIAELISSLVNRVDKTCADCGSFNFALGVEELNGTPTFVDPNPLD
jgi:hypothetical protein